MLAQESSNEFTRCLQDLEILGDSTQFPSNRTITQHLKHFSTFKEFRCLTKETISQLGKCVDPNVCMKLLLFIHKLFIPVQSMSIVSEIIIKYPIELISQNEILRNYYIFLYKLGSNNQLLQDHNQDDFTIYFTLSNHCNFGINLLALCTDAVKHTPSFHLIQQMIIGEITSIYDFLLHEALHLTQKNSHLHSYALQISNEKLQDLNVDSPTVKLTEILKFQVLISQLPNTIQDELSVIRQVTEECEEEQ